MSHLSLRLKLSAVAALLTSSLLAQIGGLTTTSLPLPVVSNEAGPTLRPYGLTTNNTLLYDNVFFSAYRTDGTVEGTASLPIDFSSSPLERIGGGDTDIWFVRDAALIRFDTSLNEPEINFFRDFFPDGNVDQLGRRIVATEDRLFFYNVRNRTDGGSGDIAELLEYRYGAGELRTIFSDTTSFRAFNSRIFALGREVVFSRYADGNDVEGGYSLWAYSSDMESIRQITDVRSGSNNSWLNLRRSENYLYAQYSDEDFVSTVLLFQEGDDRMEVSNVPGRNILLYHLSKGRFAYAANSFTSFYGWDSFTGETELLDVPVEAGNSLSVVGKIRNDLLIIRETDETTFYGKLYQTNGKSLGTELLTDLADLGLTGPPTSIRTALDNIFITSESGGIIPLYNYYAPTRSFSQVDLPVPFTHLELYPQRNHLLLYGYTGGFPVESEYAAASIFQAPGGTLEVNVFRDTNGDGLRQENEPGLPNYALEYSGNGTAGRLFSNQAGFGRLLTRAGVDYSITPQAPSCYEITTDSSLTFTATASSNVAFEVGLKPAEMQDPSVNSTIIPYAALRCGFVNQVAFRVENDGCSDLFGVKAFLTLPEGVSLEGTPNPAPVTNLDDRLGWEIDSLVMGSGQTFVLTLQMPGEEAVGQPIVFQAEVAATDNTTSAVITDTLVYHEALSCAIDPNDKQVAPRREDPGASNFTLMEEALTYTIRFQNTGNDTAFTVRVEDQLSENLNWNTFKPVTASHPYTALLSEDGLVSFLFEDILLPDSTTNEVESHGFVSFVINVLPELEDFTVVDNTAGIFFDFNEPVITNTVSSTLVEFLDEDEDGFFFWEECDDENEAIFPGAVEIPGNGIDDDCSEGDAPVSAREPLPGRLAVFPNPVRDLLQLRYDLNTEIKGELFSMRGRRMRSFVFRSSHEVSIGDLPPGVYFLQLVDVRTGAESVKKIHVFR